MHDTMLFSQKINSLLQCVSLPRYANGTSELLGIPIKMLWDNPATDQDHL